MDVVAAVQQSVQPGSTAMIPYSCASGAAAVRGAPVTHAGVIAAASAASKSMGLTASDALTVTAPLSSLLGFGAGIAAAQAVNARACEC